jgi:hypothetical protein
MNREEILAGSTEEKMRSLYARHQRASINDPATIGDIPQEVLRKAFIYLLPGEADLIASSEACSAWRPVAQELIYVQQKFGKDRKIERFVCGFHLHSLVFGMRIKSINVLDLDMGFVGIDNATVLAQIVAPSLSILGLELYTFDSKAALPSLESYAIAEVFFLNCLKIRSLSLFGFNFGDDPVAVSPTIKEGFGRLRRLCFDDCRGDISKFVENTPICDLQYVRIWEVDNYAVDSTECVKMIAESYRTIINFDLDTCYISTPSLLKIVECCPNVEQLSFNTITESVLQRSDIEALASLSRLKNLNTWDSVYSSEALSSLSLLKGLKHLGLRWNESLAEILPVLGEDLMSLDLRNASADAWMVLYESCPDLQYLRVYGIGEADKNIVALNGGLKKRKKRLASFKIGNFSVRLGTDWTGYKGDGDRESNEWNREQAESEENESEESESDSDESEGEESDGEEIEGEESE